jgi:endonuclease/exonuclease/phosphatase family metal-dependent hydrolase
MIRILTVNAQDLYACDRPADTDRYARLEHLLRSVDADVIAVQEIIADGDAQAKMIGAGLGVRRLAAAIDRRCEIGGETAATAGGVIHHLGLLWRDGLRPVPGSLHRLTRDVAGMWHGAVSAVFEIDGARIRVGSTHLSPFDAEWRLRDVHQLLRVFNGDDTPGLLGGDFNCVGADPGYDDDPYRGTAWHPGHAYHLADDGTVDRRPAYRLEASHLGRMRDCARMLGRPWQATTNLPQGLDPARRVDRWYATHHLPEQAVVGYQVIDAADTSDHHFVLVSIDPAAWP